MTKSAVPIGLAVATCVLLAACGGRAGDQQRAGDGPSDSPVPVVSLSSPTGTPATGSQPETTPPPVGCQGSDVKVTKSTNSGAAGTIVQRFIITNTGTLACSMEGNPVVKVEPSLSVDVKPIPAAFGPLGASGGKQMLAVGDTAIFFLKWSQIPAGSDPCPQADGFDFRPPQDQSVNNNQLVSLSFTPCDGEVQVSDVLPPTVGS